MTMSRLSMFARFSLVLAAIGFLHCGSQLPDSPLETCPDGTMSARCVPMTCIDQSRNGAETDVDCGGPTCAKCTVNQACAVDTDCDTGLCAAGVCATAAAPSCTDGVKNAMETDVDCGGTACNKCALGKACAAADDCLSATCNGGLCATPPAVCTDGIKNGSESAVDCGGSVCPRCDLGKMCLAGSDCLSATCSGGQCVPPPATCTDGLKNGSETDVDCGGPTCNKCALTKMCVAASDCASAICTGGRCVAPPDPCKDGVKNGSETDVDCGGPTCGKCALLKSCVAATDCLSGACANNQCATVLGICIVPPFMLPVPLTNPPYASATEAANDCITRLKGKWM